MFSKVITKQTLDEEMPPKKKYRLSHRKSSDDRDVIVLKSISAEDEPLKLDVWPEDELEPVQNELHNKVHAELEEVTKKIEQIARQANTEIIYQGQGCSIYEIDLNVVSSSSSSSNLPVSDVVQKKKNVAQPKGSQANVFIKPKQNNSYQLVMDPRLGLIVGTMTPAANTPISSPIQNKSPSTIPTVQTKTPPVRRRGRNSVQAPPAKPPKALGPPPLVDIRSKASPSPITKVPEPPKSSNTSAVVDLTTDENRPLADSREISFNKLQGKTFPSLVVVARPHLGIKDVSGGDRSKLDSKVKSVLMHVPTKFTEWLIQQGLVRSEQTCLNHPTHKLKLGMYSDVTKFPYSGGYVWISECCPHRFVSVFNGSLFEGAPHPPGVILKLIYHWACQTNVQNVVQWVKVDNLYVKGMYTWLRAICTVALHSHVAPLGGSGRRVEVGVISLGTTSQDGQQRQVKVEVLGVLESKAKLIRLRAVEPLADGDRNYKKRFSKILEPLAQWVHRESTIVTDLTVDKGTLNSMGFLNVQQSTSNEQNQGNHMVMDYLRRIVPRMFQNTLSLLSRQIIQQFLDELVWREWYGTTAADCFDNLLTHLSEQTRATGAAQSLIMRLNKVAANPFKNCSIATTTTPATVITKPQPLEAVTTLSVKRNPGRQRKIINFKSDTPSPTPEIQLKPPRTMSPDVPEQMVNLENYYYGTIEVAQENPTPKIGYNIKCTMCKSHFSNNLRLMNHLFSHAHSITGGIQQCRYCLSSVASPEGLAKHIITSHPSETRFQDAFICIICEARFANSFSLGKHLSKEHLPAELPYQCGTCGFRCSSHRQVIDHFYKEHDNGSTIQCPFCLKSTTICNSGRIMPQNLNYFMQHLQKHQKKTMAKKCQKCALWFIHKDTLKDHQINMHSSQRSKPGLTPWMSPKNGLMVPKSKQDKQVWEDSEREINFSNLTIDAPNKLNCRECKSSVNSPNHFQSLDGCTNRNCQFSTCCRSAMVNHLKICKKLNESLPICTLSKKMFCVCGYSDTDGNTLASHLAKCERKSAYPTAEDAKKAIKPHNMLDVLGLVRRPEEPATRQRQAVIDVEDKDEKGEVKENLRKSKRPLLIKEKSEDKHKAKKLKREKLKDDDNVVLINDEDEKENKSDRTKKSKEGVADVDAQHSKQSDSGRYSREDKETDVSKEAKSSEGINNALDVD